MRAGAAGGRCRNADAAGAAAGTTGHRLATDSCCALAGTAAQAALCADAVERAAADSAPIAADGAVADADALTAGHAGGQNGRLRLLRS